MSSGWTVKVLRITTTRAGHTRKVALPLDHPLSSLYLGRPLNSAGRNLLRGSSKFTFESGQALWQFMVATGSAFRFLRHIEVHSSTFYGIRYLRDTLWRLTSPERVILHVQLCLDRVYYLQDVSVKLYRVIKRFVLATVASEGGDTDGRATHDFARRLEVIGFRVPIGVDLNDSGREATRVESVEDGDRIIRTAVRGVFEWARLGEQPYTHQEGVCMTVRRAMEGRPVDGE